MVVIIACARKLLVVCAWMLGRSMVAPGSGVIGE